MQNLHELQFLHKYFLNYRRVTTSPFKVKTNSCMPAIEFYAYQNITRPLFYCKIFYRNTICGMRKFLFFPNRIVN